MATDLYIGEFGPPLIFGRVLLLICAYRGASTGTAAAGKASAGRFLSMGRLLHALTLRPLIAHIAMYRDHYANPRPAKMQVDIAAAALTIRKPSAVRVVVDTGIVGAADHPLLADAEILDLRDRAPAVADVDTIVIAYADALGLGFTALEARLRKAGARNIVVVNGRRRIFPLTASAGRSLRWRRFLASTRIPELVAAVAILPTAAALAGYDILRRRDS